ncbi:hypothetical protein FVE85_8741 [Porphyridium purpureum]|uniref:Uncharacterized protein n=1 Tax=Porphyridium purpureum TaxID=35688 RepID=A0A5J4YPN8_PORPP|nr:hypothetical protein FVE85_8741 [Porphyridium purpureum]|eukprot:POR6676..scf296_7
MKGDVRLAELFRETRFSTLQAAVPGKADKQQTGVQIRRGELVSFPFGQIMPDSIGELRMQVPTYNEASVVDLDSYRVNGKEPDKAFPFLMGMDALEGITLSVGETLAQT